MLPSIREAQAYGRTCLAHSNSPDVDVQYLLCHVLTCSLTRLLLDADTDLTEQQWQDIFEVNLKGAFLCAQGVAPTMKASGEGRILIISSGAGLGVSLTGIQAYASAKAGQIGLVRQLAHELGPYGITVNSVAPGFIRSNPSSEKQWIAMGEEGQRRLMENIPLRRLGASEDIANAVMFLVSDLATYITGQTLSVNGGR